MPAVLTSQNAESHAELEGAVSQALDNKKVTLAENVLTESNTLIVELKQHSTIANNPIMGRRLDRPDHFTLNKTGNKCVLTHDESGAEYVLESAECVELPAE